MCGFLGVFAASGQLEPGHVDMDRLERLRHRGPDGQGWFIGRGAALGFRRLAIIDVAGGAQPLFNEDERVVLTLNGEIYNHHALRQELEALGHRFRAAVDAEVVVHGYEAWGEGVLDRLRGMFALALYDRHAGRLLLARDRVGQKPLYWTWDGEVLRWASEIRALTRRRPPIDRAALNDYLRFGYVPAPLTLLSGVHKLGPGELLTLEVGGQPTTRRWWRPPVRRQERAPVSEEVERRWAGRVREALAEAVDLRLESEVPLGFLLSGGIDSAAVFALGARGRPGTRAFTIGIDSDEIDETGRASAVATRYGAAHLVRRVGTGSAIGLAEVVARCEEPVATDALIPTDQLFRAVSEQGVTTVLAGEGADELFAGYAKFALACPEEAGEGAWEAAGKSPLDRYLATEEFAFPDLRERDALLGEAADDARFSDIEAEAAELDPLSQMLFFEICMRLPDRINLRLDRLSMACAIEARAPFMDHRLIEVGLAVPHAIRRRPGWTKWVLRQAMRDDLPSLVVTALKAPFRIPDRWVLTSTDHLRPERVAEAGLVKPEAVEALRARAETETTCREKLYNLAVLHAWYETAYQATG